MAKNQKENKSNETKLRKTVHEDFKLRKEKYNEMKELRNMLKKRREEKLKLIQRQRIQIAENRKRKEENELKAGNIEIIKNPEKMKKWKVKARRLIRKVPKDIFYGKYFNEK